MKRVFLHIGEGKTGTSAIQLALNDFQNRALLAKHDFALIWKNLFEYMYATYCECTEAQPMSRLFQFIEQSLNQIKQNNIIISCEGFSGVYWSKASNVSAFAKRLQGYDVQVIQYLRRQDQFIESAWAQDCKVLKSGLYPEIRHLPRKELLDAYAHAFGKENITVKVYDRKTLYMNDSICDFLEWVGLERLITEIQHAKANPSLSPASLRLRLAYIRQNILPEAKKQQNLELMQEQIANINGAISGHIWNQYNLAKQGVNVDAKFYTTLNSLLALEKTPQKNTHAYFNAEVREKILAQHQEENDFIAREYLGREDGVLFDNSMPKETISLAAPSTDDIVASFLPIFVHLSQRIDELERKLNWKGIIKMNIKKILSKLRLLPKNKKIQ